MGMDSIRTNARIANNLIAMEESGAPSTTLLMPNPRLHASGSLSKEGLATILKHASSIMNQALRTPLPNNPRLTAMRITMEEPTKAKAKEKEKAKPKAKVKAKVKVKAKAKAKAKVHGLTIRTDIRAKTRIL